MEGGLAEVRKLHIVYFLSRQGRIEHPHLVRVRRPSRNGVHLRDVKRWLGELRGKEMPESFSWSYKRKYKTGYVWQDLLDDDLITPISDNEYVLKGSEILSTAIQGSEEKITKKREEEEDQSLSPETSMYVSTKSSPDQIEQTESQVFGSDASTVTDDSGQLETNKDTENTKQDIKDLKETENRVQVEKNKNSKVSFQTKISTLKSDSTAANKSLSETRFTKSKSRSNGGSSIFRNLMTCGVVDTKDSTAFSFKNKLQKNKPVSNMCASTDDAKFVQSSKVCTGDRLGGSQRVFGNPRWTQQSWNSRKSFDGANDSTKSESGSKDQMASSAASCKLVKGPNCSQCGKPKPGQTQTHMNSCNGIIKN